MEKVTLKPLLHRENDCIGIYFPKNNALQSLVQHKTGAKWSRTHTCWYVPMNKENYERLCRALKGKVMIENESLKTFLRSRKEKSIPATPIGSQQPNAEKPKTAQSPKVTPITCEENIIALQKFRQMLVLKGYSSSTARTYTNEFIQFLNAIKNKPAPEMTEQRVKDYLEYCYNTLHLSENTLHSRINALKFYYEQILKREKFFWDIPRPKKPFLMPNVLGENEIARLFNAVANLKHKAILFTAYSAGLRVSEVTALQIKHVDSDRMQLLIKDAKGKKDRYVALSPIVLDILRSYLKNCNPKPKLYVFEGATQGQPYSNRSAQKIFQMAREKAHIQKDISFHGLRHSFATHLLEKGIDVKFIQEILGHFDIKTTMRYLHVRKEQLVNIVSPLDDLIKKGGISI